MVSSSFQIAEKLELLLTERESLYATWEDHKTELDQAYNLHVFLRDAKQIDTFTSTQEVIYNNYSPKWRWLVVALYAEPWSSEELEVIQWIAPDVRSLSRQ